jgi:hypothetical protein
MNTDELNTEDITAKDIIKILPQNVQQTVLALIEEKTNQINEFKNREKSNSGCLKSYNKRRIRRGNPIVRRSKSRNSS